MSPTDPSLREAPELSRRAAIRSVGIGATALLGITAASGTAAAWERNDIDFKGCSEVWIIVAPSDIDLDIYDPPTVAHVIVETTDGTLDCRLQEFTPETTTTIPGQYGDAPVLKYSVSPNEKILGVIIYNYSSSSDRFERNSPLAVNPNQCASTPGTADPSDASCADNTYITARDVVDGPGQSTEPNPGQGGESQQPNESDDSPSNGAGGGPDNSQNGGNSQNSGNGQGNGNAGR